MQQHSGDPKPCTRQHVIYHPWVQCPHPRCRCFLCRCSSNSSKSSSGKAASLGHLPKSKEQIPISKLFLPSRIPSRNTQFHILPVPCALHPKCKLLNCKNRRKPKTLNHACSTSSSQKFRTAISNDLNLRQSCPFGAKPFRVLLRSVS